MSMRLAPLPPVGLEWIGLKGILAGLAAVLLLPEAKAVNILAIGSDLTAEYAFQTQFSAPDSNPTIAKVPNWVEFLATERPADFNFGSYAPNFADYEDARICGYGHNWGITGLNSLGWAVAMGSSGGPWKTFIRDGISAQLPDVEVVVIMIGMQDLLNDYGMIFEGTEPAAWFDNVVARIRDVIEDEEGAPPVVLCTVPDVGATPAFSASYPDPVKRAAARAKILAMNNDLKALAGTPVADIHAVLLAMAETTPYKVNAIPFIYAAAPENPPDHLLCKDGIHPALVANGLIAQEVVNAIISAGISVPPVTNNEILQAALAIQADLPFTTWISTQGVLEDGINDNPDGDAFDNLAEFAFDLRAGTWDPGLPHDWSGTGGDRFGIVWQLAAAAEGYVDVGAEWSTDLTTWTPISRDDIIYLGSGYWRASIPPGPGPAFVRAVVRLAP